LQTLWQVLVHAAQDADQPLSCEECYLLIDYLADLLASGYPQEQVLRQAEKYLSRCPDCRVEHQHALSTLMPGADDQDTTLDLGNHI
jgi:hypothetical protein